MQFYLKINICKITFGPSLFIFFILWKIKYRDYKYGICIQYSNFYLEFPELKTSWFRLIIQTSRIKLYFSTKQKYKTILIDFKICIFLIKEKHYDRGGK